jgi:sulfate adenylyltransferase subunit 1
MQGEPLRMPVQWVNRPHLDFRGFCGTIAAGTVRPGDQVQVASSGKVSRVARIVTMNGDLPEAIAGQAVTLTLTDEIDISRGDLLTAPDAPPLVTRHPEAHLVWLSDEPLQPGQIYLVKTASSVTPGRVTAVRYGVDVNTLDQNQVVTLGLNGIGVVALELDRPVAFDPYRTNRDTGSFIVIDRFSNATVGAGMVISAPEDADRAVLSHLAPECARTVQAEPAVVRLSEANIYDLTTVGSDITFEVTPGFIAYLGQGNRVLLRLNGIEQVTAVAALALEQQYSFEFDPSATGINILLFRRGIGPVVRQYAEDGVAI